MNAYEARIMHEVRGEGKEREGGRRGKTRERGATFCLTRSYQLCFLPLRPPPPPSSFFFHQKLFRKSLVPSSPLSESTLSMKVRGGGREEEDEEKKR
jgi:hypothetical protein